MNDNAVPLKYKIGIYVRESRDDNEENYDTIETQRDLLLDYVKKNQYGEVVRIYIDDNESGSIFERKGIDLLTLDVKQHFISMLVLKDLSRLGRNNAKTLLFLDFLEENSIRVITFDGRYDSLRDNDTVGIDTWYNERYVRDISKKIRANLRFKIEKGEYIGNAPFGYKKTENAKNKLCIDNDTAEIVKYIFKLYLQGYGYTYIAKTLNTLGYPTPSMKNCNKNSSILWNGVTVKRILFNRVYIGDTVQGISEKISFKSKKTRRLPTDRWVITEKTHEGIISETDFEEVNRIRTAKESGNGQHKGIIHLFKGIIYCGKCGSIMYARQRSNKPMAYICSTYFKYGKKKCTSHYIKEELLCDIVRKEIEQLLCMDDSKKYISEFIELKLEAKNDDEKLIEKFEKVLLSKQKQQEVIYMDRLEGKISDQLFLRTNQNIETRISQLRHDIEKIRSREDHKTNKQDLMDCILNCCEISITNELIKYFVDKIIIVDQGDSYLNYDFINTNTELNSLKDAVIIYFKI
jgi:site-specific DNA recombinase